MKQIEHNGFLLQEVPEDAVAFEIYDKESLPLAILVYRKDPQGLFVPGIPEPHWPIPPGNWQIISKASEISEGQAKGIVEDDEGYYPDFEHLGMVHLSPSASFHSLLRHHGLKLETTIILFNQLK